MTIKNLEESEINELINLNKLLHPSRFDHAGFFRWQILENPLVGNKSKPPVLIYKGDQSTENNKIVGQFQFIPFDWCYNGTNSIGHWGVDYNVIKEHRGLGGILLAKACLKNPIPYFGTGPSKMSRVILAHLNTQVIGKLDRFIWFRNPIVPLLMLKNIKIKNKNIQQPLFPSHVSDFQLIQNSQSLHEIPIEKWKNTIEFSRKKSFIKWRFFNKFAKYGVYQNPSSFFVVRVFNWKGIRILGLIDYKLAKNRKFLGNIIKSAKIIARLTNCLGIVTMSSNSFFDTEFKRNFFIKAGEPNLIITNAKIEGSKSDLSSNNLLYATMADSDSEFGFWQ